MRIFMWILVCVFVFSSGLLAGCVAVVVIVFPSGESSLPQEVEYEERTSHPSLVRQVPLRPYTGKDVECAALNIYHEARGESMRGQRGVTHVVMNRVRSRLYPNTVCGVIKQITVRRALLKKDVWVERKTCQFSWWCDGKSDKARDRKAWAWAVNSAHYVLSGLDGEDVTGGALNYHATSIRKPQEWWRLRRTVRIDSHIFYRPSEVMLAQN